EAVQGVGVLVEVDLEHLGALALGRPRLLENGRLLTLEGSCKVGAAALRLGGFLAHPFKRRDELCVLFPCERDDATGSYLRSHRQPGHLPQLALQIREIGHIRLRWRVVDTSLCPGSPSIKREHLAHLETASPGSRGHS